MTPESEYFDFTNPRQVLHLVGQRAKSRQLRLFLCAFAHELNPQFDLLPILADALQEAGCTNSDILQHCHSPRPHVRGCWVVDLLLGKA
jgi:hypothetical protein